MDNIEKYIGERVMNKKGESGLITKVDEFIHVDYEERSCMYEHDAFEKGYLEFVNTELSQRLSLEKCFLDQKELDRRLSAPLRELNSLVGLGKVKRKIDDLVCQIKISNIRRAMGLKVPDTTNHMVFMGNPGTGKTTVARIIAKIYNQLGLLTSGHMVEVDRGQLVAGYQGQTSLKTKEVLNSALGGVLFIDEAYSLCRNDDDDYGQEAIDTITKFMEDHRDNIVIIVAGYSKEMVEFINTNPGLKSRFKTFIDFDDYSGDELFEIFSNFFLTNDYELTDEAREVASSFFKGDTTYTSNGRDVRNMFEKSIIIQARRLNSQSRISKRDLISVEANDLCLTA